MPITGLTSASEPKRTHTGTRMPLDGLTSASKHTTTHTEGWKTKGGKRKGRPERSAHLLPTYLIWYEDQGDVVPLQRDKGLA